jgi:uncharacterized membrane protein
MTLALCHPAPVRRTLDSMVRVHPLGPTRRLQLVNRRRRVALAGLTALVGGSGLLHLVVPRPYRRIVPAPIAQWRSEAVALSGLAEIACALLLLARQTRRVGAYATASLFVAVFPANVQMALDGGYADAGFPANNAALAWLRLPLQVPLILWALSFRHEEGVRR